MMKAIELIEHEWGNFENIQLDFGFRNSILVKHPDEDNAKFCESGIKFHKGIDKNDFLKGRKIEGHWLIKNGQIFSLDGNQLFVQLFQPLPCCAIISID